PEPLPVRDCNAGFDAAIRPCAGAASRQSRRGILAGAESLSPRLDHELSLLHAHVLAPIGVKLLLVVPPAIPSGLRDPRAPVERRSVELVVPHQPPPRTHWSGGASGTGR